jgi:hypothetical protein
MRELFQSKTFVVVGFIWLATTLMYVFTTGKVTPEQWATITDLVLIVLGVRGTADPVLKAFKKPENGAVAPKE